MSDLDELESSEVLPTDMREKVVSEVLKLADRGFWGATIHLPNGRTTTVGRFVRKFHLQGLLDGEAVQ